MGTLVEKLDYLEQTKKDIQQAIIAKGVEVGNDVTFRDYATKVSAISGGGGGETVFAVNNTGAAVTKGTKALLNSHQRETTATAEKLINSTTGSVMYFPFCKGNDVYAFFSSRLYSLTYTPESDSWAATNLNIASVSGKFIDFIDGNICSAVQGSLIRYSNNTQSIYPHGIINPAAYYIGQYNGEGRCLACIDSRLVLTTYDFATDTIGTEVLCDIREGWTSNNGAKQGRVIRLGNKVLVWFTDTVYILDLTTNTVLGTTANIEDVAYATGCEPGDYVFVHVVSTGLENGATMTVYKINENYQLVADTPGILLPWTSVNVKMFYNASTGVLNIGTAEMFVMFQFNQESKTFASIAADVLPPSDKADGYFMTFDITADRTKAAMCYYTSRNYLNAYNLSNASDAVYADPVDLFHFYPDNSVTGFATGATDETGKYEFKTVTGA